MLVQEKFVRNLNGNKKNIGKRNEQKRWPGGACEGSAGKKTEQGIAGQTKPGCGRTGENDGESDCEVRNASEEKNEKRYVRQKKLVLDFNGAGKYNVCKYKYRKPCKRFISNKMLV